MVSAVSKNDGNFHLGRFDDYRLIYSDTTGRMRQFGFKYDDNIDLPAGWSELYFCGDEILYYPQYLNSIYSVTDSAIRQKYIIDCRNFTPFDQKRIAQYNDWDKFCEYWYSTTNLESKIAETGDHLYFGVNNKRQLQYYFYNKRTQTLTGFKTMLLDREFAVEFSRLYSYGEYFVGTAPVPLLKELKAYKDRMGEQMSDGIGDMIDRLKEEDNDVLVLFKLKQPEA
ncbi:MAG: 6-bladed beta-propeller [Bacteroidales bacterium]|jgi:hypothetical protein|nr:6-bladed beta-propeller [Bacteroidales bacterium]